MALKAVDRPLDDGSLAVGRSVVFVVSQFVLPVRNDGRDVPSLEPVAQLGGTVAPVPDDRLGSHPLQTPFQQGNRLRAFVPLPGGQGDEDRPGG